MMREGDTVTLRAGERIEHSYEGRRVTIVKLVPFSKALVSDVITGAQFLADITWLNEEG